MKNEANHNNDNNNDDNRLHGAIAGSGSSSKEAILGLLGGMVFGLVSPIVGHPFDTTKTKMQAEVAYQQSGFVQSVKQIYRVEGLRGFYKGFIPPLVGSIAFRGVLFSTYSGVYATCSHYPLLHDPIPYTGGLRPSVLIGALAASFARATIESPLDFIKVRYQIGQDAFLKSSSSVSEKPTPLTIIRSFMAEPITNIRHLYQGYLPTLFRTMGLLGSFFVMVDYSVRYIPDVINAPLIGPFFKGGVCATTAWVFAFPFETTKSIIQADSTGKYRQMKGATWYVLGNLYREKGIRGWYRGFGPGAGRSFVANGASMMVYSWFQDTMRS